MNHNLVNLNTHSYYTFLSSSLSLEAIINFSLNNNLSYASLVDVNVMYGAYDFYLLCLKNNLKPILGLQFNYQNCDLVMIAKNYDGYKILCKISSLIMTNKDFDLDTYLSNNIFLISLNDDFEIDFDNFYYLSNNDKNIRTIACQTAICLDESEFDLIKILDAIANEKQLTISSLNNNDIIFDKLLKPEEFANYYSNEQIRNLEELVQQINLEFPKFDSNCMLVYPNELGIDSKKYLSQLAHQNLEKYLLKNKNFDSNLYFERLNYELDIICKHNFADYFLIVQDFVNYSKNHDIMIGPGRGSAAGSLVAFVLNIVEVDPIKYNLIFERFLNVNRLTMPDIDTDVMDTKRNQLIDYLFDKYTRNHVAHIATFARIKSKQAIRDIGRVLSINQQLIDKICKILTKYDDDIDKAIELNNDLKNEYLQNFNLFKYAKRIMNFPRQIGVHAAGIVISNYNLTDAIAIQSCLDNKTMVQISMDHLTDFGLVKIDILGLRNLTIIHQILLLIERIHNKKINLNEIDLNDQNVYKMLTYKLTLGIFQFESTGMTNLLAEVKPKCLEDLSLVSAIYRPGASSNIAMYLKNRNSSYKKDDIQPIISQILDETYGMIVYQEQIIKLVQLIANFDANKADQFRVAISKKKESEVIKFKSDFIDSAQKNNYSLEEAQKYFETMLQFASYGFNHSHSISYALISYWLAYFKYYYPLISYSVFLTYSELDQKKTNELINEAKRFNIEICLPDINISTTSFCLLGSKIYFALTAISGIGHDKAKKIIELRKQQINSKFDDAFKAIARMSGIGINKAIITKLIKSGAFDSINRNRDLLLANLDTLTNNKKSTLDENGNFIFDFDVIDSPYIQDNYYEYEQEVLGIGLTPSKIDKLFENYKNKYNLVHIQNIPLVINQTNNVLLLIKNINEARTRTGSNYKIIDAMENNTNYSLYLFTNDLNDLVVNKYYLLEIKISKQKKYTISRVLSEIKNE